jgi:hypothetical protein
MGCEVKAAPEREVPGLKEKSGFGRMVYDLDLR